ncbi:unnamed protein product [Cylicostephanus goldi]|uniref:Uncharacterized protein n=1 Tax=Cylicostephanus goldi TaxID=71465 RepID=A0A3P6SFK4_CYLGO|nr:unnamed protein product [Cylicostephanus goldi]
MEELLPQPSKSAPASAKKGARRARVTSRTTGIDIVEQPEDRFVGLARLDEITMVESQPIIWKREDLFQEETDQAPVHFSRERFIDWNDQRTSSSKESMKTLPEVNKVLVVVTIAEHPNIPDLGTTDARSSFSLV